MADSLTISPPTSQRGDAVKTGVRARRFKLGLLWRILLASLLVGLLPLVLLSYNALSGYQSASAQATDSTATVLDDKSMKAQLLRTEDTAKAVAQFLESTAQDTRTAALLARTPDAYMAFYQTHQRELWYRTGTNAQPNQQRANFPLYREMAYIDASGHEQLRIQDGQIMTGSALRDVSNPANTTYKTETYFSETRALPAGQVYVSHVTAWFVPQSAQLGKAKNSFEAIEGQKYEAVVRFGTPVFDAAGKFAGIVLLSLDHRHIMEYTMHIVPTDQQLTVFPDYTKGNYAWMFDNEGWQIAHPNYWGLRGLDPSGQIPGHAAGDMSKEERGKHPFNLQFADWAGADFGKMYDGVTKRENGLITIVNQAGVKRAITYAPIIFPYGVYKASGIFGGVTIGANMEEFHKAANTVRDGIERERDQLQIEMLGIAAAALIFVVVMSSLVSRGITRPLLRLTGVARKMEEGELDSETLTHLLNSRVEDEVTKLTQVFKQMGEQVQLREKKLKQQIVELHIQIDEQKRREQVSEITETEYFQNLRANVSTMRERAKNRRAGIPTPAPAPEEASESSATPDPT